MLDTTKNQFSHVKPGDTAWRSDGLRDFFLYRDLGVEQATAGRVRRAAPGTTGRQRRRPRETPCVRGAYGRFYARRVSSRGVQGYGAFFLAPRGSS